MHKLVVTIIVKNEAKHIARCLDALDFVDAIIVVDSGSQDGTQAICRRYPQVTLHETDWPGFGKQKNRALDLAESEWVLSVDADEVVSKELAQEIIAAINSPSAIVGYKIPRLNCYFGAAPRFKKLHTDWPLRLFKKAHGRFTDDPVHERVLVEGKVAILQNYFLHYALDSLEEMVKKANLYSSLGAAKLSEPGRRISKLSALLHASWAFIRIYFLKGAGLEGWSGFLLSLGNWLGTFLRYAKAIEKQTTKH